MKTEAKLSAKKRKSLPGKSFCAPNRGFPANDCNHVKAGLSLLGRYKGPGSKSAIRACLNRKAKALGCFKSKESEDSLSFEPAINEYVALHKEGMLSTEDVFVELIRFAEMGSVSNEIIAAIAGCICAEQVDIAAMILIRSLE